MLNGEKSSCSLETLTQASALQWDYEDIIAFKKHMPQLAYSMELVLLDRLLSWVQQNQIEMICLSAEERYRIMLERHPEVILKIPLKYIATYLGIHTDSLSRIRKKVVL